MDTNNSAKDVVLNFGPSNIAGHGSVTMSLSTDAHGWARVHFKPDDPIFCIIGDFLEGDIGIGLWSCDAILESGEAVLAGEKPEWRWSGDSFIVEVQKVKSRLIDIYGDAFGQPRSGELPTPVLLQITQAWRDFVSVLPRQLEFQEIEAALEKERASGDSEAANPDRPSEPSHGRDPSPFHPCASCGPQSLSTKPEWPSIHLRQRQRREPPGWRRRPRRHSGRLGVPVLRLQAGLGARLHGKAPIG
jgi:hypothetical protein